LPAPAEKQVRALRLPPGEAALADEVESDQRERRGDRLRLRRRVLRGVCVHRELMREGRVGIGQRVNGELLVHGQATPVVFLCHRHFDAASRAAHAIEPSALFKRRLARGRGE